MPTRRTVLLGPAAAAISTLCRVNEAHAEPQSVRYNVASPQGQAMLRIYAQGVSLMRKLPASDPRSWTFQWYIHATPSAKAGLIDAVFGSASSAAKTFATDIWYTCQSHLGQPEDYFLPWHRIYVMKLEDIIRALTAQPAFTMPYWDYTSSSSNGLPDAFQAKNKNDPVFSSLYQVNRNKDNAGQQTADVNAGEPLNKYFQGAQDFLVLPDLTEPDYSTFCNGLDGNLHGAVHVYTGDGSNMGSVPTAAEDPVFWLHHCNIDRIWMGWNAVGHSNPTQTNGTDWSNTSFVFADSTGARTSVSIASVSDSEALPYKYEKLPGQAAPQVTVASGNRTGDKLLMMSVEPTAVHAPGMGTVSKSAAVPLGAGATTVTLGEAAPHTELLLAEPAAHASSARFMLKLKNVQAVADPGTTYKVYLSLPPNASPEVADQHYVGLLNFFGVVMDMGARHESMSGRTVEFDVTAIVRRLNDTHALRQAILVTLAPVGTPKAGANAVIAGGVELLKR